MTNLELTRPAEVRTAETVARGVQFTADEETYDVFGGDDGMLELAMKLRGPRRNGRVFAAFTDWEARWTRTTDGPRVHLLVVVTLPVWEPPRFVSPDLLDRWASFRAALTRHEQGHVEIGLAAARALREALAAASPKDVWAEVARDAVSPFLELERWYDAETAHGATQGATLRPPRET